MSFITVPFSWLLLKLYDLSGNYGLAVILFALVVNIIMLPFQMKSKKSMMRTTRLAPRLKELERRHEGNQRQYQEAVAKLYRDEHANPMSGCLWTLIPLPILIVLYGVIQKPLTRMMQLTDAQVTLIQTTLGNMGLYEIPEKNSAYFQIELVNLIHEHFEKIKDLIPGLRDISYSFLGLNLGDTPQWNFFLKTDWSDPAVFLPAIGLFLIPVVSAALSYFSMKITNAMNPQAGATQGSMKSMTMTMPLVSLWIGFIMPAALGVYWIATSLISMVREFILTKIYMKQMDQEDAERAVREKARENELEQKRLETEKLREAGATARNENTSRKKLQSQLAQKEEERRAAIERAAAKKGGGETPPSQVGRRVYARGRAYNPDRFASLGAETTSSDEDRDGQNIENADKRES